MAHLISRSKYVNRILTRKNFLDEVRYNVAHGKVYVSRLYLYFTKSPRFANADTVERSDDCVGELVLIPCRSGKILDRSFLESIG
jgi:hypothetical protein